MKHKIAIGGSNFETFIKRNALLVDKTFLIQDLLDDGNDIMLTTRPRRWGKTLNLSMLNYFFSIPTKRNGFINEAEYIYKRSVFSKMNIANHPETIETYCGEYPTIFVSFKDVKSDSYEGIRSKIARLIQDLYITHIYLKKSDKVTDAEKVIFQKYLDKTEHEEDLEQSIKFLNNMMYAHFGRKAIILIDEYDTPMNDWYAQALTKDKAGCDSDQLLQQILSLFRGILSATLKDNAYLERAVITGILRIAKASLFSGLNNLGEDSILDHRYAKHFGFTENEVDKLLQDTDMDRDEKIVECLRSWYNGYNIGGITIYNPWSIMNYLNTKGELKAYWVGTANTTLIENALILDKFQEEVQQLIEGNSVSAVADTKMVFSDIKSSPNALYNLLLFSGYLTAAEVRKGMAGTHNCMLRIPNKEVSEVFEMSLIHWLINKFHISTSEYELFITTLLEGEFDRFITKLSYYLSASASFYSTGIKNAEIFYNGFMMGIISSISHEYIVETERESGDGRVDLLIIPRTNSRYKNALILEFKIAQKKDNLKRVAQTALTQIKSKNYKAKIATCEGIMRVFKIGLAFCGKEVEMVWEG